MREASKADNDIMQRIYKIRCRPIVWSS